MLRRSSRRICYLHIGTPKTGTSAIQKFIMVNADRLYEDGFFVPRSGFKEDFLLGGHVNVAREFAQDPEFSEDQGTLSAILEEASLREAPCLLLSSEMFSTLHHFPDALTEIRGSIVAAGYEPILLIFLRSRLDYAQSLYVQLTRHGLDCPFDEYLDSIVAEGKFSMPIPLEFRYSLILDGFVSIFGDECVRAFRYGRDVLNTYLHAIDASDDVRRGASAAGLERVNESMTFREVAENLFENAIDLLAIEGPDPHSLASELFGSQDHSFMDGPFDVVDAQDRQRFVRAFAGDGIALAKAHGVHVPTAPSSLPERKAKHNYQRRRFLREAAVAWRLTDFWSRARQRRIALVPRSLHIPLAAPSE